MTLGLVAAIIGANSERVQLDVSGAPGVIASKYASDFSATVDSWSGVGPTHGAPTPARLLGPYGSTYVLNMSTMSYSDQYIKRTLTGLTIGHTYQLQALVSGYRTYLGRLGVVGVAAAAPTSIPPNTGLYSWVPLSFTWTATATSHDIGLFRDDDDPFGGALLVAVTVYDIPVNGTEVTIQRDDANGSQFVRLPEGAVPDLAGDLTVFDEEFALTGTVIYTVRDSSGNLAADTVSPTNTANLLSSVGYLGSVVEIERLDEYSETVEFGEASTTLAIIGREDPLVVTRGDFAWSLRKGRLTWWAETYADAEAIKDLYRNGRTAMLRQVTHDGLDLYHVARSLSAVTKVLTGTGWRWTVEVDYLEVSWPDGDAQGVFGWSYGDVASSYLAYYNLPTAFATYADLAVGP